MPIRANKPALQSFVESAEPDWELTSPSPQEKPKRNVGAGMKRLTVFLTDEQVRKIKAEALKKGYAGVSEYIVAQLNL